MGGGLGAGVPHAGADRNFCHHHVLFRLCVGKLHTTKDVHIYFFRSDIQMTWPFPPFPMPPQAPIKDTKPAPFNTDDFEDALI